MQRTMLTMPEVSELTGVPIDTLRYWRKLGQGPISFKLGRRVVYAEDDLNAWIKRQREDGSGHG